MKRLHGSIVFLLFTLNLLAQQTSSTVTIAQRFARIWHNDPQEKVYLHTDKHMYSAGETIWLKAYLVNATTHQPSTKSNYVYVELLDSINLVSQRIKMRRDGAGAFGMIKLPADYPPGEYTLRAYTHWMQNTGTDFFFHKKISLGNLIDTRTTIKKIADKNTTEPADTTDFDVRFFPEGGYFFTGAVQLMAFKAIGTNGLSDEISGVVYNQQQEEVSKFSSSHRGMGKLALTAMPGDSFYAMITNSKGHVKRFELPSPVEHGIGLKLSYNRGKINFQVFNNTTTPIDSLRLLIHLRGEVLLYSALSKYEGQLPENFLPAGIATFAVMDISQRVWSERLFFSRNFVEPLLTMTTDRAEYLRREPVELTFLIQKPDSTPLPGSFSVSVTDSYHVKRDTLNNDIQSYLLLSSDLKGYIESPQEYFSDNSMQSREKADLLMLTQGWRRFNTAEIAKANYPAQPFYMEVGQAVSGKVINLFRKPVKGNDVMMLSGYKNQIRISRTDSLGQYNFEGIEFPDSTNIIIKAMSKSKIVDVEVIPDIDRFPLSSTPLPSGIFGKKPLSDDYLQVSREKYYIDGGIMVIDLDEVTIDAQKKSPSSDHYYSNMADNRIDAKKLEDYQGMRVMDILYMLPGVEVNGDQVSIRGSRGNPLFLIDGIQTNQIEDIIYLNATDVEEILLFKGPSAAIFGSQGGNGAIAFTLKRGYEARSEAPPSLVYNTPLGFQIADEFYVPKYEVDSVLANTKRDLRTTVYWNPEVQPDSTGRVTLKFFTADNPNDYTVELEGLGHNGTICRYRGIIRRK